MLFFSREQSQLLPLVPHRSSSLNLKEDYQQQLVLLRENVSVAPVVSARSTQAVGTLLLQQNSLPSLPSESTLLICSHYIEERWKSLWLGICVFIYRLTLVSINVVCRICTVKQLLKDHWDVSKDF